MNQIQFQNQLWRRRLKLRVFTMYGNCCACCGETNLFFLDLDHVNNDGRGDRRKTKCNTKSFSAALKNPERFQILCSNCNSGKSRNNGVCPHKSGSVPDWYVADLIYGA